MSIKKFSEKIHKHFIEIKDVMLNVINPNSQPYQRPVEDTWVGDLINRFSINGYDRAEPITLNDVDRMVDGQHRYWAAVKYGMIKIPSILYRFDSYEDEVKYYFTRNTWTHQPNNKAYWNARREMKDPLALQLYALNNNNDSLLYGDVNLLGLGGKRQYSIHVALLMMNFAMEYPYAWRRGRDDKIRQKLEKYDDKWITDYINGWLSWLYSTYSKEKDVYHQVYTEKVYASLLYVYDKCKRQHKFHTDRGTKATMRIFGEFKFDQSFLYTNKAGMVSRLVSYYNHAKGGTTPPLKLD